MKILIVDDHALIRKGLKLLLNSYNSTWEVHEAINGLQAVILAPKIRPEIVLMDYSMPKLNGDMASRQMIKDLPGVRVIMISGFLSHENINNLLQSGVMGIVSKTAGNEEVLEAIHDVMHGKQYLTIDSALSQPEEEVPSKVENGKKQPNPGLLTPRELEVMQLIVTGHRSDMITRHLAISPRTLHVHKANIFRKCHVHSTAELLRYAYKNNLA